MILITLDLLTADNHRQDIIRTFRKFIEPTGVLPGCLDCRLLDDVFGDGRRLLYTEAWASESDFLRRVRSSAFKKILSLMELSDGTPDLQIHTVTRTRGLAALFRVSQPDRTTGPSRGERHRGQNIWLE